MELTPTYPILRPNREGTGLYLDEDVEFTDGDFKMTIPKGYLFDGHSVPKPFQAIFNPFGRDVYAALIHDRLYEYAKTNKVTRRYADKVYNNLMNDPLYKVSTARSIIMPMVVDFFGWSFFYLGRK